MWGEIHLGGWGKEGSDGLCLNPYGMERGGRKGGREKKRGLGKGQEEKRGVVSLQRGLYREVFVVLDRR